MQGSQQVAGLCRLRAFTSSARSPRSISTNTDGFCGWKPERSGWRAQVAAEERQPPGRGSGLRALVQQWLCSVGAPSSWAERGWRCDWTVCVASAGRGEGRDSTAHLSLLTPSGP